MSSVPMEKNLYRNLVIFTGTHFVAQKVWIYHNSNYNLNNKYLNNKYNSNYNLN